MSKLSIKELAASMDVSEVDVLMFAQSIANGIEKDKIDFVYLDATENIKTSIIEAYAAEAVIKFNNFQATLMTNKGAKDLFILDVFNKLKQSNS